jgi:8-oxo-dGTP diphosphatase
LKQRIRAAVILAQNQKLLLVKHVDPNTGEEWWIPPGGGLAEEDPSILECAVREVFEETGLQVSVGRLVYFREFSDQLLNAHNLELYFIANDFAGEPTIENVKGKGPDEDFIQDVRWLGREEISILNVFPPILKETFWEDLEKGFPKVRYLGVDLG